MIRNEIIMVATLDSIEGGDDFDYIQLTFKTKSKDHTRAHVCFIEKEKAQRAGLHVGDRYYVEGTLSPTGKINARTIKNLSRGTK